MTKRTHFNCPSVDCFAQTLKQRGNGVSYYGGRQDQMVGYGALSQWFGKIFRFALPLVRKYVVPTAKDLVSNTLNDYEQGKDLGQSFQENIKSTIRNVKEKLQKGSGGFKRPLKRRLISLLPAKLKPTRKTKAKRAKKDFFELE